MKISIIIPTYREAENLGVLVPYLLHHGGDAICEIIVSDAQSDDDTLAVAASAGARAVTSPIKGRAAQMNHGAALAQGEVFYFIHADSFPPPGYAADIADAIQQGFAIGRYRTKFSGNKWFLALNAFFTRFDLFVCYGGDQTLFITRDLFSSLGGFNASMHIMEDYDMVARAKQKARYRILPKDALVSSRKYDTNSWWRVQYANYCIVQMFKKGASQQEMIERYKNLLRYR